MNATSVLLAAAMALTWHGSNSVAANAAPIDPEAAYRLQQRELRAAYTRALGDCRQHPASLRQECRSAARKLYENDLDRALQNFVAAKQQMPLETPADHYRNDRREAYAAFEQAKDQCNQLTLARRPSCMEQASRQLNLDLLAAKAERTRRQMAAESTDNGSGSLMRGGSDASRGGAWPGWVGSGNP